MVWGATLPTQALCTQRTSRRQQCASSAAMMSWSSGCTTLVVLAGRKTLFIWFRQQQGSDVTITKRLLREQAKAFGVKFNVHESFTFSSGWMQKFKKRYACKSMTVLQSCAAQ
jgi:hypothetical protein